MPLYQFDKQRNVKRDEPTFWVEPSFCPKHRRLLFYNADNGDRNGRKFPDSDEPGALPDCCFWAAWDERDAIKNAYAAARAARFEFGESGAPAAIPRVASPAPAPPRGVAACLLCQTQRTAEEQAMSVAMRKPWLCLDCIYRMERGESATDIRVTMYRTAE
jgi:hypothetical protein